MIPVAVSETAKQAGEVRPFDWVERSIWTDRMLDALVKGVKGDVWFSLIDKVYRPTTIHAAWQAVRRNKGSAGTDHESVKRFEQRLEENVAGLEEELRTGTYRPRPIKRVYIDKLGSKEKRPLGGTSRAGSGSPDGDKAGYRAYLRDEVQISQLRFQAKQRKQGCLAGSGSVLEGRLHPCGGCRSEGLL
jgi:hypothetical protein